MVRGGANFDFLFRQTQSRITERKNIVLTTIQGYQGEGYSVRALEVELINCNFYDFLVIKLSYIQMYEDL